jgi:hypothetical protein
MNNYEDLSDTEENDQDSIHLIANIKEEFVKKLLKNCLIFGIIGILLVSSLFLRIVVLNTVFQVITILCNIFLAVFFVIEYITLFTYRKMSPSLISFLIHELDPLGYKVEKKFHHKLRNFFIFTPYFIFILLINIRLSFFVNDLVISVLLRIFIIYILIFLIIPIITGRLNDYLVIYLPSGYNIAIFLKIDLFKHRFLDSNLIKIYMKSSQLFSGRNAQKLNLFRDINERRRLKKSGNLENRSLQYKPKYYFNEISTIINYRDRFINIVSAVREWDQLNED